MWRLLMLSLAVVVCTCIQTSGAQTCPGFGLAKYYSSHMVFQRTPARPRIWGYSDNVGDVIWVTFDSIQSVSVTAETGPDGRPTWSATFNPIDAPGPFQVTVLQFDTGCQIVLDDVLVGDVWLCSGQSNMQHPMYQLDNPAEDLADVVNYPEVRTFFNDLRWSNTPVNDLLSVIRPWAQPTPSNINDFSAVCWLYGRRLYQKLQRPIGLIETNWGGTRVEAWSSPDALQVCFGDNGPPVWDPPNGATQLYNAMIHPFHPFPIYGAIWYQGESNTGNWWQYACAIRAMVSDWRTKWNEWNPEMNDCFPFGEVQLAPWRNQNIIDGFPDIRWAQTYNYGFVPNNDLQCFFTAVALDLPDYDSPWGDIHPRYKRQIADRLYLAALPVAYGINDEGLSQGPLPVQYSIGASSIEFTYDVPLEFRATTGFELCCSSNAAGSCTSNGAGGSGGSWIGANVVNTASQSVELNNVCQGTANPFAVGFRYAWRESPCAFEACAVYSVENSLPAPPYYWSFN